MKQHTLRRLLWDVTGLAGILVCLATPVQGVEVAGELFVDLDAATLSAGDTVWANAGSYTDFMADGNPFVGVTDDGQGNTTPAVFFDGASAFYSDEWAPEGLTGSDPTRSIEVWALNENISSEETLVAWGKRGGGDGTNMSFNYGTNQLYGAVGHWGTPDLGWNDAGGAPEPEKWHHLVYTFDQETTRVYSDGELWNEENIVDQGFFLDTHMDAGIAIASQWEADGVTLTPTLRGSLAIGRVRVHDEVLTDAQILSNYNEEEGDFHDPASEQEEPVPVPTGPVNRYSFDNPVSDDATGALIVDSVGGEGGIVVGDGSSFTGTEIRLDGGDMNVAAYVDLPNGLISRLTDATIEGWMTIEGLQSWQRMFDFGSTAGGELEEPGGGGNGQDQWMLSAAMGTDINSQRFSMRNLDPEYGGEDPGDVADPEQLVDLGVLTELDEEFYFAAVYDSDGGADGGPVILAYRDGEFVGSRPVTIALGNLNDVNNWLGRSNWTADANTQGTYNEFRIYDYAFTDGQILWSFECGPDSICLGLTGDYNNNGELDAPDLDLQAQEIVSPNPDVATYDLNSDGLVNFDDRKVWVEDLKNTWIGDANLDLEFNSGDMVQVFAGGKYESGENAGWEEGDWNGDTLFSSGDMVAAFAGGGYEQGKMPEAAVSAVPEPSGLWLLLLGVLAAWGAARRR